MRRCINTEERSAETNSSLLVSMGLALGSRLNFQQPRLLCATAAAGLHSVQQHLSPYIPTLPLIVNSSAGLSGNTKVFEGSGGPNLRWHGCTSFPGGSVQPRHSHAMGNDLGGGCCSSTDRRDSTSLTSLTSLTFAHPDNKLTMSERWDIETGNQARARSLFAAAFPQIELLSVLPIDPSDVEFARDPRSCASLALLVAMRRGGTAMMVAEQGTSGKGDKGQAPFTGIFWRCKAGHTWWAALADVERGSWCETCQTRGTSARLTLDLDFELLREEAARASFTLSFAADMATTLGLGPGDITVDGVTAGSVVVDFSVSEAGAEALAQLAAGNISLPSFDEVCASLGVDKIDVKGGLETTTPNKPRIVAVNDDSGHVDVSGSRGENNELVPGAREVNYGGHGSDDDGDGGGGGVATATGGDHEECAAAAARAPPPARLHEWRTPASAATVIQCAWRCAVARGTLLELSGAGIGDMLLDGSAIIIQSSFRKHRVRAAYAAMVAAGKDNPEARQAFLSALLIV